MPKGKTKRQSGWISREKKRCSCIGCRKRAKDVIKGHPLCRIHSPLRLGFKDED